MTSKPCGCDGPCSSQCRLDRWALRHVSAARQNAPSASQSPVNGSGVARLKPSALKLLGRLQAGPMTNREAMDLAGFRYSARLHELAVAGHRYEVTAPGPTPGVRVYRLVEEESA